VDAQKFEVGDAIRFGWETTKANLSLVVILTLVAAVATGIPIAIAQGFGPGGPVLAALFGPIGAIVSLVVSVVAVGLILLIVPGVIFSVRYMFYGYAVVERNARPLEAMAQSAAATRGAWWNVSLFGLAILLLNILGALLLGVGLLVTAPMSALAAAWVYRRLTGTGSAATARPAEQPAS